jgi:hypothetical protein
MRRAALAVALALACAHAMAQHAGCPPAKAPPPTRPAGEPPAIMPPMAFPKTFDEPMPPQKTRIERSDLSPEQLRAHDERLARRRAQDFIDAGEDGHVAQIGREAERATRLALLAPGRVTPLAGAVLDAWKYEGALEDGPARVSRFWRRSDGTVLAVSEWDEGRGMGVPITLPDAHNAKVGHHPATLGGVRGPSGCVLSSLSWSEGSRATLLRIAGPVDVGAQRKLLGEIGDAILAARRKP